MYPEEEVSEAEIYNKVSMILKRGGYLLSIVSTDERPIENAFTIRYFFKEDGIKVLKLNTESRFPSITSLCPSAKNYEREIRDMFGLVPEGHPDSRSLILYPENWDPSVHPLRKDYDGKKPEFKKYGTYKYKKVLGEGINEILVGPIHAGIIEPGHFRFSLAGEAILQLEIRHFWKHRGIEKLCEGKNPEEVLKIANRISGDNAVNISLAYLNAVEPLLGIEVSRKVSYLRCVLAELERIWNHVRDLGWLFMDIGFPLPAQHLFSLQEELMRLNKALVGHRFMFDAFSIGGVNMSMDKEKHQLINKILTSIEKEIKEAEEFALETPSVRDRFETTGRIFKKTAMELSLCGVCARASGLSRDTRVEMPYLAYKETDMEIPVREDGDVMARFMIRVKEIYQSVNLIRSFLENLPIENVHKVEQTYPTPYSWNVGNAETPRGNAFFFIMLDKEGRIYRLKYTDPSFRNWPAIQYAVLGDIVADFPLVNKSMNLSYAGNDL
ncbi:MAG: NADH-quinone oxidoreductase subunit C [Hydrogenobacter sp.]